MTDHSITPPQWRVQEWWEQADQYQDDPKTYFDYVATEAARWGADQELKACCALLELSDDNARDFLYSARRPKPPSLKEQALLAIDTAVADDRLSADVANVVRRALEQIND